MKHYYFFHELLLVMWMINYGVLILGSRDAGKGIVCDSISTAFGKYIAVFNADSLMFDKNSGDAAKKISWAYHFDKKRISFLNEIKVDNTVR